MANFLSNKIYEQKYNELFHKVDLYLDNSGDLNSPKRYHINPGAIVSLVIRDTVNDWVADGELTFLYIPEENIKEQQELTGQSSNTKTKGSVQTAAAANGEMLATYEFRGDGFDLLRVMVVPKSVANTSDDMKIDEEDTKWHLSYLFSVSEIEDVNTFPSLDGNASTYLKCLKLKFHDVRYQMLKTTNLEYSTSFPKNKSLVPDFNTTIAKELGVLYTGDILKDIFNETLGNPILGGCEEFKIKDEYEWDKGKSMMFYTSPAQYSALDDVNYVYSHHVSEKNLATDGNSSQEGAGEINDLCLLHTERPKKYGEIEYLTLTPLMNFFEKAGKEASSPGILQKEHFFVTHLAGENEASVSQTYKAPLGTSMSENVDIKTAKYGQITSYSFVDMSALTNSELFRTTPVYSIDIGKRQFNTEFNNNNIKKVRNVISKSYISKLYKTPINEEDLFLPILHESKQKYNIFPTFSLNGTNPTARQKNGLHMLLYTGLFQNACVCFKTLGLTWRESGTFIGIDRIQGSDNTDYANKLFGQWFVVRVDHVFEAGSYINIIYAVKMHRFNKLNAQFAKKIS